MQELTQTGQPRVQQGGLPYKWIVAIVVIFGVFMSVVDTTIVYRHSPLPNGLWSRPHRCAVGPHRVYLDAGRRDTHDCLLC